MKRILIPYVVLMLIVTFSVSTTLPAKAEPNPTVSSSLQLNISNIIHLSNFFSSVGTRVTGYPGYLRATEFIINAFNRTLGNVQIQKFKAAIPIDEGSYICIKEDQKILNFSAYSLWPNGPQASFTPPEGITGKLVYVGSGNLAELDNEQIKDSIVLMDFNSGENWLNVAKLGAKAVIFILPNDTNLYESLEKAIPVPVYFPRVAVNESTGALLKEISNNSNVTVILHNNIHWKEVDAYNIISMLNGTELPSDVIVVTAHYDSWSIVPRLSYSAEDSLGISVLLEIARYFSINKPKRSIWFVAMSGFWEGLVGPSVWVENTLFNSSITSKWRIWMTIELDLSSENKQLDAFYNGYWSNFWADSPARASTYLTWVKPKIENYLKSSGLDPSIINYNFRGSYSWGTQPLPFVLAIELVSQTGSIGFALRPQFATRYRWFTPLNDSRFINWENVEFHTKVVLTIVSGFSNDESWNLDWSTVSPKRMMPISIGGTLFAYVTLNGRVAEFNETKGWYTPVPGALVRLYNPSYADTRLFWPFLSRYAFSDHGGNFTFYGLLPYIETSRYTAGGVWQLDAWKFNDSDGSVSYAVDNGIYGTATGISGGISNQVNPIAHPWTILLPVFRCVSVTVFDFFNPQTMMRSQIPDLRSFSPFYSTSYSVLIYDYNTRAPPTFYGSYYSPQFDEAVFFVKPYSKVVFAFKSSLPSGQTPAQPLILLTNSSESNPEGSGYFVTKPLVISFSALQAASDMYHIVNYRYELLRQHFVVSPGVELLLKEAKDHLYRAKTYYNASKYDKAYSEALLTLALISETYANQLMPLYYDSSTSIIFFGFLLLPFSVLFESLVFHFSGIKKTLTVSLIFFGCLFVLYLVHPAFAIISNSTMSLLAAGLTWFTVLVLFLFSGKINDLLTKISEEKLGIHHIGRETSAAVIHTLLTSVENMRRRKLLTFLTLSIILSIAVANTALTSTSLGLGLIVTLPVTNVVSYKAIAIKASYGIPPDILDTPILTVSNSLSTEYIASPRVWFYPVAYYPYGAAPPILSSNKNITIPIVFLGLSDFESELLVRSWIENGTCSFTSYDSVIIPKELSHALNLTVGSKFRVLGIPFDFTVIGIFNEGKITSYDFDGKSVLPIDQQYSIQLARIGEVLSQVESEPQATFPDSVIILPWKTAKMLGGFVSSIAFIPRNQSISEEELLSDAKTLALSLQQTIYCGSGGKSFSVSKQEVLLLLGYEALIPLLVISALEIVSTFLSNVKSRQREIYVYSSVGLSPGGISAMYLTESIVYALLGSMLGYVLGFVFNQIAISFGILPKSFAFNFSSFFIVISLLIVIFSCIAASIYPSLLASRLVTPSLERKWNIPTKPSGDNWIIPLPFVVSDAQEGMAILLYLKEFFTLLGYERTGYRIYNPPVLKDNSLEMFVNLTPMEYGISQTAKIELVKAGEVFSFNLVLHRETGDTKLWHANNYAFVDDVRKQLLLWRSLPPERRKKYFSEVS